MGFSETYIKILKHPIVDATIEFIKKFKSSKSYWSVSYFILLFTLREAIAWKFGSVIKTFCETQAVDSSFPMVWDILGFFLDVGGSWELVALGTFLFVVLSLVKVAESEGTSISVRENYLTLFLLVFVGSVLFYQSDEIKEKVEENNKVLEEIKEDNTINKYLVKELTEKDIELNKYIKAIKRMVKNDDSYLEKNMKILEEEGIDASIFYLKFVLSYLKSTDTSSIKVNKSDTKIVLTQETNEINTTDALMMEFIDKTVEIDGLIYENIPFTKTYTWDEANDYCLEKNDMGKKWRLPTRVELHKLSNVEMYGKNDNQAHKWFDRNKYKRVTAVNGKKFFIREEFIDNMSKKLYFWTNEDEDIIYAWHVSFYVGVDSRSYKTSFGLVLCVSE